MAEQGLLGSVDRGKYDLHVARVWGKRECIREAEGLGIEGVFAVRAWVVGGGEGTPEDAVEIPPHPTRCDQSVPPPRTAKSRTRLVRLRSLTVTSPCSAAKRARWESSTVR
jgi:hypothetical protein